VSPVGLSVFVLGVVLELCLLWRLLRRELWRRFPFLSLYFLYVLLVMNLLVFVVGRWFPAALGPVYWICESFSAALRFFIVWEVFRHMFPAGSPLHRASFQRFVVLGFVTVLLSVSAIWGAHAYAGYRSPYPALERSFGFAQAALVLVALLMARIYGVRLGRNVWGIAVGFGIYASISVLDFALVDLNESLLFPYWQVASPLSFNVMIAFWTWALWTDAPNPAVAASLAEEQAGDLRWWAERWAKALSSVRRIVDL
jgi:hypothetical protein